jgi:hypothetical protein
MTTDPVPWERAMLIAIAAILFFKYGKRLRGNSRFAQGS